MTTKLTLTLDDRVIDRAKVYARRNRVSLSKMVEFYFKSVSDDASSARGRIPPITRELTGIAEFKTNKSDRQLLTEALTKRHMK